MQAQRVAEIVAPGVSGVARLMASV